MQEGWARLRRALWQPPRPHGEQPRERVVGPLELFDDLAVVVLVAQAAHRLAGHLTWAGLGQFAAVFTLVWIAWANGSLHHELHGHDDARARSTFLLQILVLAAMGAFISQAGGARGQPSPSPRRCCSRCWPCCGCWPRAATAPNTAAEPAVRGRDGGRAVLLAGTALLPAGARVPAWGVLDVAYLIGFSVILVTTDPADAPGMIITEALTERFGAFIIIVLGETLTGVVTGLSRRPIGGLTLAVGLVAVVVGFGAWWTYFDFAGQRHPRTEPGGQRAVDTRPPAAHRRGRRDGRRDGQPRRPRPRRSHPGRHGVGTVRGRRGRARRDDTARRDPAGLAPRPRPVPAALGCRPELKEVRYGGPPGGPSGVRSTIR